MASPFAGPSSPPKLTGSTPGVLDSTQPDRLLTFSNSTLSFASFNPRTATSSHLTSDARKLSLNEGSYNPKRVVIETSPTGEKFWRFVPKARLDEGVVDEGDWPRVVDICGTLYECTQDQWDIYKLDPVYNCRVRAPPAVTTITRASPKSPESPQSIGKRTSTKAGIPPLKPRKKLHTHDGDSSLDFSDEVEEVEDMAVDQSMPPPPPPRARSASLRKKQLEPSENPIRNTPLYDQTAQRKRTRKVSPGAAKRELDSKRAEREKQRQIRRQARVMGHRQRWHEQFMQEVYAEVPDLRSPSDEFDDETEDESSDEGPSPDTSFDEEAARAAAIAESRRKLAELEADRPLWEEEAKKRAMREAAEEESRRLKAEERKYAEMRRAEAEARRAAESRRKAQEIEEKTRQQQEAELREQKEREEATKRQRERRQREQRWNIGPWTPIRALERYRVLSEAFDTTKFNAHDPLSFHVVPWPILTPPARMSVEDVDWNAVESFFDAVKSHMRTQEFKMFVEKSQRRFHPDRWRARGLLKTVENEAERSCLEVEPNLERPPVASVTDSHHLIPPSPSTVSLQSTPASSPTSISFSHTAQGSTPRRSHQSIIARFRRFLGYGPYASKARRQLVHLIWILAQGIAETVAIVVLMALFAPKPSPTVPGANEWTACERPLGVWSCLWLVRVIGQCLLTYWEWIENRSISNQNSRTDPESNQSATTPVPSQPIRPHQSVTERPSSSSSNAPQTPAQPQYSLWLRRIAYKFSQPVPRLSLLNTMYYLTWFLTAHILIYTSINTCRHSSPHIWWLAFGILCQSYILVVEVILLGIIIFIFAPVVLLLWNLFLFCIGRHPEQNPHIIKPDIHKLSKGLVDRIPLVMYIPPPPNAPPSEKPIQIPADVYSYPPKSPVKADTPVKKRFRFIRFKKLSSKHDKASPGVPVDSPQSKKLTEPRSWEEGWDTEGYPYVVLEDNRAACAICLLDFEEPKRLHPVGEQQTNVAVPDRKDEPKPRDVTVEVVAEEERENTIPRLTDAGEGAQPLRLLKCGHVFHKTCLDPWLTDVSGRCPVCQRPVEIADLEKRKKGRRR
ncbi:hypothetical protein EV360DRAFT_97791 [Lentinula raphanica]|nr:hypothetical protein EV360DRAFT_97791 [Lentinula raphanica]